MKLSGKRTTKTYDCNVIPRKKSKKSSQNKQMYFTIFRTICRTPELNENKEILNKNEEIKTVVPMTDQTKNSTKNADNKPEILAKPYTKYTEEIAKITKWIEVPIKELRDYCKYEMEKEKVKPSDFVCPICQTDYYENLLTISESDLDIQNNEMISGNKEIPIVMLSKCQSHFYHKECLINMFNSNKTPDNNSSKKSLKCPVCGIIYGIYMGDMPDGRMYVKVFPKGIMPCAGYEKYGTIVITYVFPDGIRNNIQYYGTMRESYLPDIPEGRLILRLLKIAFERRLTFTVGTSVTTGEENVVVWNGIHHKTNLHGGSSHYGYPDKTYFNRVKEELAAKGVFENQ